MRDVAGSTFALLANGSSEAPPAAPLCELLLEWGARRVTTVFHPLDSREHDAHELTTYASGWARRRRLRLPSRTPLTYPIDLLAPPLLPVVDGWIAFNNLLAVQGLAMRRLGRAARVVYSAVDFVPDRFGRGPLTAAYDRADALACARADTRWEVSDIARRERSARLGLAREAPAVVVPLGARTDRVPTTDPGAFATRTVVYVGHLVERQGVEMLLDALALLRDRGDAVRARIAGRGPLAEALRARAHALGLEDRVRFLGYLPTHADVEAFLAAGTVGVAAYDTRADSFTRFADPGKLKAYAAAGLPIVTTDVAPNTGELAEAGAAVVAPFSAEGLAAAIGAQLADARRWRGARAAALRYAARFDWPAVYAPALRAAGFAPPPPR